MILLILLTYSTITALAQTGQPPEIYYGGEQTSGAGAYTFTYNLISKSNNITKWQLERTIIHRKPQPWYNRIQSRIKPQIQERNYTKIRNNRTYQYLYRNPHRRNRIPDAMASRNTLNRSHRWPNKSRRYNSTPMVQRNTPNNNPHRIHPAAHHRMATEMVLNHKKNANNILF